MRKLTGPELDEISDIAVEAVEEIIFSRVSKKEILDLHINVEISYEDRLDVDILVDLDVDKLSNALENEIVEDAVDTAIRRLDNFISNNYL